MEILNHIKRQAKLNNKLLAVLIDPDKAELNKLPDFIAKTETTIATHIFVGGSTVKNSVTETLVKAIKQLTKLPVILFPGDITQIAPSADGILFLSLLSGRNPDYLIEKHIQAVSILEKTNLEIIPTGYLLIENGKETAVERVTNTKPLKLDNPKYITDTAKAGELLGMQLTYLEAGSGALNAIPTNLISKVKQKLNSPLIVGGGIRTKKAMSAAYNAGADLVVIGTAFETNEYFYQEIKK